jgi:hypothetical protein
MDERKHECPMCGSLMGAEAQPAAMKKRAEILDELDRLERRLREAEAGSWRIAAVEALCGSCRATFVGIDVTQGDPTLAPLRARIAALREEQAEALRRSA